MNKNSFSKITPKGKFLSLMWGIFLSFFIGVPLYIYFVSINLFHLFGELPSTKLLENPENELTSELYSADGELLGKYYRSNRSYITYSEISPRVVDALLSTEDFRFKDHSGIDFSSLMRVLVMSIILNKHKGGGSTLTQQLAKNLFNTRGDSYKGLLSRVPILNILVIKSKEWLVAVKLERAYTKEEIISMYLNTVSFGSNSFGLKSASNTFFNKEPIDLTVEEAALLIGLLRAPTRYSPVLNPKNSLKRRNVILGQMLKSGHISEEEFQIAKSKPLGLRYKIHNHKTGIATYFRNVVSRFLLKWGRENGYDIYSDGLKIYTTIDSKLQREAEEAVKVKMEALQDRFYEHWGFDNPWADDEGNEIPGFIDKNIKHTALYKELKNEYGDDEDSINAILNTPRLVKVFSWKGPIDVMLSPREELEYNKKLLRVGFLAMEPRTGHIKAWVGGVDYSFFQFDHVLQGKRQPGSLFKGIVYTAALDNGFSPDHTVRDLPITFHLPGTKDGTWTPRNWSMRYTGEKLTLRRALTGSVNSVTAYLIKKLGPEMVVEYAKKLGIHSKMNAVPSLCLGVSDVSLIDMVGAYNTFVNKGIWIKPIPILRIEDKYGNVIEEFVPSKKEAIGEETAKGMLYLLRGAQEEPGGSVIRMEKEIKDNNQIAAKSGTTQNQSDGWYITLTHNLSVGVWVGGEDRCIHFRDFRNGQSGRTAKPIVQEFLKRIYTNEEIMFPKGLFPEFANDEKINEKPIEKEISELKEIDDSATKQKVDINFDNIY